MAVPVEKTVADITGCYVMNPKLSGSIDEILKHQGIGWMKRKALGLATVTITITHKTAEDVLDIHSDALGVIKSEETTPLDGKKHDQLNNPLWGNLKVTGTKMRVADIEDEILREGWVGEEVIEIIAESEVYKWKATQIWGFQDVEIEGAMQRRYFRRVRLTHQGKESPTYSHMIYDYSPKTQ
ncbi:hypothetical protein ABW20_dc0102773 [Dactylellina cionopaga]|nr:hypothetical protein ABW20_dc0102773 [Dactylellina cionopaga]